MTPRRNVGLYTYDDLLTAYQHAWTEGFSEGLRSRRGSSPRPPRPGKVVDMFEYLNRRIGELPVIISRS